MKKQIVYVDLDNTLVDFQSGIDTLTDAEKAQYGPDQEHTEGKYDNAPGIFSRMKPYDGGIEAFKWIAKNFDTYILSTAPWENPSAWCDKLEWVKKHLGEPAHKRLILSHHKNLLMGDYLIDDSKKNGVDEYKGRHLHFGKDYKTGVIGEFPDWESVLSFLRQQLK